MTEDDQDTQAQREYERLAKTLNPLYILDCVLSDLDGDDSPLLDDIKIILANPSYDRLYPTINLSDAQRIGKLVLTLVERAVANQVNLKLAVGED